jgi:hypothetical protein
MEQNGFVVTFKGDVIELRNDSGPVTGAVSNGNELGFILCIKCSCAVWGGARTVVWV